MVRSLSHGHIPGFAAMAVNVAPSEAVGCQRRARDSSTTGLVRIMEALVNLIENSSSVTVMTTLNKWWCLCNLWVRRASIWLLVMTISDNNGFLSLR